ncbi:rubrerythrin family protein [Clostridium botulinum]|uniref:Rubrerythrin n=1 Tax=Clostridium botulinum (strain Eklund 17B / Type B) TaxID=935198 RepID=B2TQ11_CLOBB|nr:rubrerythrin [Clostridium botulinum B str. Eklund 17B (NRP)]MBY6975471.1 rubrerythrin family protein [Clostridium botulinum]MBY7001020.1 rubrerythrin family protein [Clostridium botulinum]MCR1273788.1 rubrerythrin family protein [Clostridium botulinum]NFD69448.1 rubrerythrin family protein [Clostridium botulinum]
MKNFNESQTKENLMRAFAGESQARNRYNIAASVAKKEGYSILQDLFNYTANQEKAHAKEFMKRLKEFSGEEITITASYPAEMETSTLVLLKAAEKHEATEHDEIYSDFAKIAKEEGFDEIGTLFDKIASIEKIHSNRFKKYADELENGTIFKKISNEQWMCTNCGYIYEGTEAPELCPVCVHPKGFFIPFKNSPFE